MTLVWPSTGYCSVCDGMIVDARSPAGVVRLDATPVPDGAFRAWNTTAGWRAHPVDPEKAEPFFGMRRREHVCVIPDRQLELGA